MESSWARAGVDSDIGFMQVGIGQLVLGGSATVAAGTVATYLWIKQVRTAAQVRARSQETAGSFDEELELWLAQRLPARWLVESAQSADRTTMHPEAIDFYNELAEKWNDEVGWAECPLIPTPMAEEPH